ncbi:hypothetical protein CYMTET_24140 [Cymbomonas tetramitiformis]|uniref:Uncharacterized protein n=1 Tax=Cymbomonas tetramitiformis TaxID=36881 RepID=A0AAE0FXS8_9CHLO|nr:hypothetical protein CYMTET_24140 [Cymbomonas tetramitiformis]
MDYSSINGGRSWSESQSRVKVVEEVRVSSASPEDPEAKDSALFVTEMVQYPESAVMRRLLVGGWFLGEAWEVSERIDCKLACEGGELQIAA